MWQSRKYVYECQSLNSNKFEQKYERIFEDNIENIKTVYRRFKANFEIRKKKENNNKEGNSHVTCPIGPLLPVHCIVNGNGKFR